MKSSRSLPTAIAIIAFCSAVTQVCHGALPAPHATDIELLGDGVFQGAVVQPNGQPLANAEVKILTTENELIARTQTDAHGRFHFASLKGGAYTISTKSGQTYYRAWSQNTAPPSVTKRVLIVENKGEVIRGQGRIKSFFTNPWALGGITAAAIAIPLALDEDDDGS